MDIILNDAAIAAAMERLFVDLADSDLEHELMDIALASAEHVSQATGMPFPPESAEDLLVFSTLNLRHLCLQVLILRETLKAREETA